MPKVIEITVELNVQKVSCPGVWLCQDGSVSLSVFTLGTSYQTCLLSPVFPLMFKDVFYFRKKFLKTCALNNVCCLLKDETIYCELVQWCADCRSNDCLVLAQYLGTLNEILFPPNMYSNDGVDLLMRRTKEFPGILSPKIEIATKVRIDEVWNQSASSISNTKINSPCQCSSKDIDISRQKQVCHTPHYHRHKCPTSIRSPSKSKPSVIPQFQTMTSFESRPKTPCACPKTLSEVANLGSEDRNQKLILESNFIKGVNEVNEKPYKPKRTDIVPCVCEICRRYHELFHTKSCDYNS